MKTLSQADTALLKSRGKVKHLTTSRDFSIPSRTKGKAKKETIHNPLLGKNLHTSWGYDMTMNDFCKILEVSKTGKTVKCRMIATNTDGGQYGPSGGKAKAGDKIFGPVFRLKIDTGWNGQPSFRGSYPFCSAEELPETTKMSECSSRMGYWSFDEGREYYENHMD